MKKPSQRFLKECARPLAALAVAGVVAAAVAAGGAAGAPFGNIARAAETVVAAGDTLTLADDAGVADGVTLREDSTLILNGTAGAVFTKPWTLATGAAGAANVANGAATTLSGALNLAGGTLVKDTHACRCRHHRRLRHRFHRYRQRERDRYRRR